MLSLLAGGVGYALVVRIGSRGAGQPLPELTLRAATRPGATLPGYAKLVGAVARPEASWVHRHADRQTRYRDIYTPLTGPGWRPGDAVALLEEDRTVAGEDTAPHGPLEGSMARGALPGWMLGELRRRGVAVVDDPVVLTRRDLGGVTPGADMIGAALAAVFGVVFATLFSGISLAWLHRRRKLLQSNHASGL